MCVSKNDTTHETTINLLTTKCIAKPRSSIKNNLLKAINVSQVGLQHDAKLEMFSLVWLHVCMGKTFSFSVHENLKSHGIKIDMI